jgi:hypothetical protein
MEPQLHMASPVDRTGPTPTITKPDLDEVRDVKPKALLPYKVVVLDSSTGAARCRHLTT